MWHHIMAEKLKHLIEHQSRVQILQHHPCSMKNINPVRKLTYFIKYPEISFFA